MWLKPFESQSMDKILCKLDFDMKVYFSSIASSKSDVQQTKLHSEN
jgi:hypothetical protein